MAEVNGAIDGLAVTLLLARDTDATARFYRDVLGLKLQAEEHDGRPRHYACPLGSVYFTIQPASDLAPDGPAGSDSVQLCFTTRDLDAFCERVRSMNVEPLHAPLRFEETTYTTLLDPDGRHVRVMTPWGSESLARALGD